MIETFRVGLGVEQVPPPIEGDFRLPSVADTSPRLGFLCSQLYGDAVVRCDIGAGSTGSNYAAHVTVGEREPGAHFVSPADDFGIAGFLPEGKGCVSGAIGCRSLPQVVLRTSDQQGEPPGEGQGLAMLCQREPVTTKVGDSS